MYIKKIYRFKTIVFEILIYFCRERNSLGISINVNNLNKSITVYMSISIPEGQKDIMEINSLTLCYYSTTMLEWFKLFSILFILTEKIFYLNIGFHF